MVKKQRICDLLGPEDAAVWLTSPAAVSWYLEGARIHTSLVGPPVAAVLVGRETEQVVTFTSEADRLAAEELPADIDLQAVPWHTPLESVLGSGERIRREAELDPQLRAARASLLPAERARFERLCTELAQLLTLRLAAFDPGESERRLAAGISAGVLELGADPVVVMVAGSARLPYRHPLVTDQPVGERAMVVVCARRHGMIANLTRWVRSRPATAQETDAEQRILKVEAAFLEATSPGRRLGEVLAAGAAAYAAHGFSADEWQNHHQGGAAGYAGRDPRAAPDTEDIVQQGQAFSWNPSAPGAKVEDTVIIEEGSIRPLTADPAWPSSPVNGLARPVTLQV